jgi:hypothetical protein
MIVAIISATSNVVTNIVEIESVELAEQLFPHDLCVESPTEKPAHIGLLYSSTDGFQQPELAHVPPITHFAEIPESMRHWAKFNLDSEGNLLETPLVDPNASTTVYPKVEIQ